MDDSLLPVTSLHHKLNQADLAFLIFVQRNKINPALCKMPITDPQHTIWTGDSFPQQTKIWCEVHETKKRESGKPFTTYRFLLFYYLLHTGFFDQSSLNNGNPLFVAFTAHFFQQHMNCFICHFPDIYLISRNLNVA